MTTLTVYGTANDGRIGADDVNYATAYGGAGLSAITNETYIQIGQMLTAGMYFLWESFIEFDTSALPDIADVSSVILYTYSESNAPAQSFTINVKSYDWGGSLQTSHWRTPSQLSGLTTLATEPTSSVSYHAWSTFSSHTTVNKTGYTRFVLASSRLESASAPANGVGEDVQFRSGDFTGTTYDPTLDVIYTANVTVTPTTASLTLTPGSAPLIRNGLHFYANGGAGERVGEVWANGSVSYAATYAAGTSTGGGTDPPYGSVGQTMPAAGQWQLYETFIAFDTSSLPDDAVIDAAWLDINHWSSNDSQAFTLNAYVYDYSTTVTTADWRTPTQLSALTLAASIANTDFPAPTIDCYLPLAESGSNLRNAISKTGMTRFLLASSRLASASEPALGVPEYMSVGLVTAGRYPRLVVQYHIVTTVIPTTATLTLTPQTPNALNAQTVIPSPASLTLTQQTPSLRLGFNPANAPLVLSVFAPKLVTTVAPLPAVIGLYPGYAKEVLLDRPAGYWRLNEASGPTAADASGNGRDGTYTNSPTRGVAGALIGEIDPAIGVGPFQSDKHVALPDSIKDVLNTASWTIEMWANLASSATGLLFGPASGASARIFGTKWSSGAATIQFAEEMVAIVPNTTMNTSLGSYHHIVWTYSGGSLRGYRNGSLIVGPQAYSFTTPFAGTPTIGSPNTVDSGSDNAAIDEVAVYDTALSLERVQAHYNAGIAAAHPPTLFFSVAIPIPNATLTLTPFAPWARVTGPPAPQAAGTTVQYYRYEQRNNGYAYLQDLTPAIVKADISLDNDRAVVRTAKFTIDSQKLPASFDPATSNISVTGWQLVDGVMVSYPLGTFRLDVTQEEFQPTSIELWEADGADLTSLLQAVTMDAPYTLNAGTEIIATIRQMCIDEGLSQSFPYDFSTLPVAHTWEVGTTKLEVINDLLESLNWFPVFDETGQGVLTSREREMPHLQAPAVVYSTTEEPRMIIPPFNRKAVKGKIANRVTVKIEDPSRTLVFASREDDREDSPTSTHNVPLKEEEIAGSLYQDATLIAEVAEFYLRDAAADAVQGALKTTADFRRRPHESYTLHIEGVEEGTLWRVRNWRFSMETGALMTHSLARVRPFYVTVVS